MYRSADVSELLDTSSLTLDDYSEANDTNGADTSAS